MTERIEPVDMSAFAGPTELDQTPPYLSDSPVFETARECQAELDKHRFLTPEAAVTAGNAVCAKLDALAEQAGLLGATATLLGPTVTAPIPMLDPLNETSYFNVMQIDSTAWNVVAPRGIFVGFNAAPRGTYKMVQGGDPETGQPTMELVSVQARLQYVVLDTHAVSTLTVANGMPCAHGPIDSTTLEFAKDTRRREAARALAVLTELELPDAQFFAHNLNTTVKSGERRYSRLRSLGHMVRHFVERNYDDLAETHKDAILDFIKARLCLDTGDTFKIRADTGSLEPSTNPSSVISNVGLTAELRDLVLMPHVFYGAMAKDTADQRAVRLYARGKRATTPALVFSWDTLDRSHSTFLHVPLEGIRKLKIT